MNDVVARPQGRINGDGASPRRGTLPTTVSVPVGGGRRELVGELLWAARETDPAAHLLLIPPSNDLVVLWHRDLSHCYPDLRVGRRGAGRQDEPSEHDITVCSARSVPTTAASQTTVAIIDDPAAHGPRRTRRLREQLDWCRWRVELHGRSVPVSPDDVGPQPDLSSASPPDLARLTHLQADHASLIAGLIDGEVERRLPADFTGWTERVLGWQCHGLVIMHTGASGLELDLMALHLAELLDEAVAITDATGTGDQPIWRTLELGGSSTRVPAELRAAFDGSGRVCFPFAIELRARADTTIMIVAFQVRHEDEGRRLLQTLERAGDNPTHPYRTRTLQVTGGERSLTATVIPPLTNSREEVVLPEGLWQELDCNVHGVLAQAGRLRERDLGASRGILLHGPPGTGKTHVARVLASEVAGAATVVFVSASAMTNHLDAVFRLARDLAPTLLLLEDVDLIAGHRGGATNRGLVSFLTNLDGFLASDEPIITVASTNDVGALDDAALRAARLDRILEVPRPNVEGRRRIWCRYLGDDAEHVDVQRLALISDGATGADIREILRQAVIYGDEITTAGLIEQTRRRGIHPPDRTGQYL